MKTLAELDPKLGDVVTYTTKTVTSTYTVVNRICEGPAVYRWTFRNEEGVEFSENSNGIFAPQPKWTLKPQPTPEPRYTLPQLNPKVGEVVLAHQNDGVSHEYRILCKLLEGGFRLKNVHTGDEWDCDYKVAGMPMWTLNPQPKEKQVTVAELNLSVGDRVTDGKRQGTVSYTGYPYTGVLWDWGTAEDYRNDRPVPFSKLLKPEPTLADLNLKVGDCFKWDGENWIVTKENGGALECRGGGDVQIRLEPNRLASEFKKLEVPK